MTGSTAPFVHPALFYRGSEEYLAGTTRFLQDGLKLGEPLAVAVPEPRLTLLRDTLAADAPRIIWLDMAKVGRNPGRIIPGVLGAFADRHPEDRVRIIGEPVWPGRTPAEYAACVQHEALINLAFAGRTVTILCPYDTAGLPPAALADAQTTHPTIIDHDGEHRSTSYAPERAITRHNRPFHDPAEAAELPFDLDRLPKVRWFTCEHATRLGLPAARVGDLELAVNELAVNSVLHAGGSGTLRIWAENAHVVAEIRDPGHLTDPLVGRVPVALGTNGGRGVLLVNHLAGLVRVHTTPEGTTTRIYMAL